MENGAITNDINQHTSLGPGQEKLHFVQRLLGTTLFVGITDGRVFKGTFVCTDRDLNIILSHTEEYRDSKQKLAIFDLLSNL